MNAGIIMHPKSSIRCCKCNMFQANGICYHTGFRPVPYVPSPSIPRAIQRMRRYVAENQKRWTKENQEKEQRERGKTSV